MYLSYLPNAVLGLILLSSAATGLPVRTSSTTQPTTSATPGPMMESHYGHLSPMAGADKMDSHGSYACLPSCEDVEPEQHLRCKRAATSAETDMIYSLLRSQKRQEIDGNQIIKDLTCPPCTMQGERLLYKSDHTCVFATGDVNLEKRGGVLPPDPNSPVLRILQTTPPPRERLIGHAFGDLFWNQTALNLTARLDQDSGKNKTNPSLVAGDLDGKKLMSAATSEGRAPVNIVIPPFWIPAGGLARRRISNASYHARATGVPQPHGEVHLPKGKTLLPPFFLNHGPVNLTGRNYTNDKRIELTTEGEDSRPPSLHRRPIKVDHLRNHHTEEALNTDYSDSKRFVIPDDEMLKTLPVKHEKSAKNMVYVPDSNPPRPGVYKPVLPIQNEGKLSAEPLSIITKGLGPVINGGHVRVDKLEEEK